MNLRGERQADFAYQAVYRYMINLINEVSLEAPVRLPSLRQLSTRLNVFFGNKAKLAGRAGIGRLITMSNRQPTADHAQSPPRCIISHQWQQHQVQSPDLALACTVDSRFENPKTGGRLGMGGGF